MVLSTSCMSVLYACVSFTSTYNGEKSVHVLPTEKACIGNATDHQLVPCMQLLWVLQQVRALRVYICRRIGWRGPCSQNHV